GGGGPADPPPQPAKPEFYEKQDILNARVETTTTIGGIPLQITTWTPANANYVIQKVEVRDEYAESTGRLRAFGFTPTGVRGGTITVDKGVDDAIDTAWVSRKTASPNGSYDTDIGWRSEVVLNTKVIGGTDTAVGVMDHSDARSFVEFTITKGTPAYVVTAVGGAGRTYVHGGTGYDQLNPARNGETPVQESARMLAAVTSEANITTMLEDHAAWWKNYWMQSYVKVNGGGPLASVEKYYYAAQYLLGASTREGKQPAGLFAHWHTTDSSTWNGDYHLNYNFISTWYGSASSNREEQLLPAVMALNDYISVARENAASTARNGTRGIENITNGNDPNRPAYSPNEDTPYIQYRLEKDAAEGVTTIHPQNGIAGGLLFPVGVGPWGSAPDTGFHGEAVNGPFSAWPMIEYYNYTLDTDFLADKAFDMVKGTATFGVGWMENYATDADGQELYRLISGYNEGSWSLNPAVELGAYKMVLEYAAKYGRILDAAGKLNPADRAMIEVWENVRAGMAAQPTAMSQGNDLTTMALCYALAQEEYKDGVWAEMASPLPSDGNIIPLESIIPSGQIGYFSPEEELQTARNTILRFGGNAWSTMNNFPKGFPVAARVKFNPDSLMTALADRINKQIQAANLRISDDAHGIEKTGAIEAINSMLIIGDKDVVKVFPNWYTGGTNFVNPGVAKKDAEFHRLRAPGAFTVSAKYEAGAFSGGGGVTSLKVTSEAGARLTIASPWGRNIVVKGSDSGNVPFDFGTAPNHPEEVTVSFDTAKGETYTFEPDGGTYSQPVNANVTFAVEPQNAVVTITGKNGVPISPVQAANGDVKTLDNGLYSYTATADGYNDKLGYFVVSGVDMTAEIAMQATASAVFDITPQTARVTVQKDGVTVGTVNGNGSLPLADGVYTYTASAPGFNQKEGKFRIDEGRDTLVQDSLVGFAKASFAVTFSPAADPAPQAAIVVWNSLDEVCEPQEAGVYMLPDGAYRYRVAAGGYATVNGTFTVDKAAADEQTVNVLLSAGEVDISFDIAPQAASDAAMKLYDAVTGDEIAPKTGRTYTLTAGKTYAYTAVKTDYLDESGMLTAEGPGSVTITMRAKATELPIEGDDMEGDTRHTTDPGFNFDGNHINNIRSDDWICYKNRFILGGITDFEIEYATMADTLGAVKVYLAPVGSQDISDGTLIISLTGLPSTGGWGAPYRTGSVLGQGQTIEPHEGGFYDIYIKFGGDGNPHAMRFTLDPNITSTYDVTFNVWPASASFALTKAGESTVVDPVPPGGQAYSLAEGLYHYKAEMPGYGTEEAVVLVKKDQTIDIRLLPPAVDISGFTAKTGLTYNGDPQGDVYTGTAVFTKDGAPVTIASPVFTDHYTSVAGYDSPTPPINAGSYTLTRTLVHDDYSGTVEIPFIIEKKPVDVQANAGYVVSKPYDGTTSAGAAAGGLTATGVLAKDSAVEAAVSFVGEYPEANAGAYAVDLHIALIGTGNSNYRLVSNTVPVSGAQITKIPPTAVHFTVPAVMEDGTEQVGYRLKPQYDGLGAPKNVTYTGTNGTTYGPSETPPTGEGYYSITAEFEDGANFNATSAPLDLGTLHIEAPALLLGGDGVVTVAPDSITHNEMTLNWTKATGRLSGQDEIRYYVYLVNDAPVALADMPDSNDTLLNAGGTLDIDSHFATNLQPQTAHTFIVVAEDTAGNRRAYNPVSETTLEAPAGALTGTAVIDNMNPSVGSVLTAALLDGNSAALSYTWISGGEALGSGETYTVKESDIGKAIQVVITAEDKTGAVTSLQTAPVVETFIAATGIALNKNAIDMRIGDREQLIAAVLPEDATNKAVIWTSSNPAVAAVDVFGMVTAAGYGEAVITAASAENAALTATCAIRVPTPPAPQTPQQPQMPAQGRGSWTGDDSNLALWIVLLCGVSVVLVGVIYRRRKGAGDKARSE
ncbi:MAG TPA: hypothetical protein DEB31_06530, partial [Clostridiales bacterium]|nr:hypothetical protein [Clostridiales bacterium]